MQSVTVEGYLAADPSILAAQWDGRKRAAFRLGETTSFKRADGSPGERTTWFNCVCFNEAAAANYIGPFARKGSRVVVHGHVEEDRWTGRDGVEHFDQKLIVAELWISNRRDDARDLGSQRRGRRTKPGIEPEPDEPVRETFTADMEDEIPF